LRQKPKRQLEGRLVLDHYVIESELGQGVTGTVYRGRHVELARQVAIKVMHEHLLHEPTLLERFRREADAAARVLHPNLVAVLDAGAVDGRPVMVMELAKGTSLADLMDGPMPPVRVFRLLRGLLRGLEHAHTAGLIHRDLKPENVIVERPGAEDELPRIVDFGIAILRAPEGELERLTGTGMMVGTPLYMSPEQAKAEPFDHRADLYAVGVMMYELLSGTIPYNGTALEVALAKIDKDPPPIAGLDPVIDLYMRKLLARRADGRFASAREARKVLDLVQTDPELAKLALGITNVERALATITLPDPPKK
jgi:serine/threonine-protein kinase